MKYPKRSQYKHAKQKKYHVSNRAEYNEGLRRRGDFARLSDLERSRQRRREVLWGRNGGACTAAPLDLLHPVRTPTKVA